MSYKDLSKPATMSDKAKVEDKPAVTPTKTAAAPIKKDEKK